MQRKSYAMRPQSNEKELASESNKPGFALQCQNCVTFMSFQFALLKMSNTDAHLDR
jgi:hypothetical protein